MNVLAMRALARLAGLFLLLGSVAAPACSRWDRVTPADPQVVAASQAFFDALSNADVAKMSEHFADRVHVIGELAFIGGTGRGTKDVTRDELAAAYARLFGQLGRDGWAGRMQGRRALLNIARHGGHHADDARAGDYVYELGRPNSDMYQPIFVFIFRKSDGRFRIAIHAADY